MSTHTLEALKLPTDYRAARERIFYSDNSLHWYMRSHRDELVAAGALLKIRGVWFIHEPRFDDFVLTGGREAA